MILDKIDQGCNLSMSGYRFYNTSQIRGFIGQKNKLATNYANDTVCLMIAKTIEEAAEKIREHFQRPGRPAIWGCMHLSK